MITEVCFAKNTAVEAGEWVANQAVQLFGGLGYMAESEVERQYRDMRILGIGGGTTEILTSACGENPWVPVMTALKSTIDPRSAAFSEAADVMAAKLAELETEHAKALAGGGEKYVKRHHDRGKMTARERIEMLLDADSPFLELSPLAAWGTDFAVGASVVTGIGAIEGVECIVISNDPTVKGGTSNPWTLKKILRANQIALQNRLPVVSLVESGGADLPTQKEIFIPGGQMFRDLTRLSAAGIPTIALVFGNSTAGGAYIPGMSDHVVMIRERSKVFLAGPPLVKMATGEESDDESLGGAEMHARTSGLADYFAVDELDAIRIGRRIVARLNWRKQGPAPGPVTEPMFDPDELVGIVPVRSAHPVRSARRHRPHRRRLGIRRVQTALRLRRW